MNNPIEGGVCRALAVFAPVPTRGRRASRGGHFAAGTAAEAKRAGDGQIQPAEPWPGRLKISREKKSF